MIYRTNDASPHLEILKEAGYLELKETAGICEGVFFQSTCAGIFELRLNPLGGWAHAAILLV